MKRFALSVGIVLLVGSAACKDQTICEPGEVRHESTQTTWVCAPTGDKWLRLTDIDENN